MTQRDISRREFLAGAVALGAGWALVPRLARGDGPGATGGPGIWLAGDLHCHTTYSHDVWGPPDDDNTGPDEFYTLGWSPAEQVANAESRLLDFLAITDHDDVRALADPGYRSLTGRLTLIPGYEHSLARGHAGCLGVSQVAIDPATGRKIDTGTEEGAVRLRDAVRAQGGLFILNHPFYSSDGRQSWGYSADLAPDSIEVWNISWPFRVPDGATSLPLTTSNNYHSLPLWESYLDRHGRMSANGGSDNHWRSTVETQGVGQPTTWVYARDRSWRAILDAIAAGRTTVSAEPPALGGARIETTVAFGGLSYMVGDTVPSGGAKVPLVVRVSGAAGNMLKLVVDGAPLDPVPVSSAEFVYRTDVSPRSRVRAEVYVDEGYWMSAISSPVYFA
jgi:hypothetical protein